MYARFPSEKTWTPRTKIVCYWDMEPLELWWNIYIYIYPVVAEKHISTCNWKHHENNDPTLKTKNTSLYVFGAGWFKWIYIDGGVAENSRFPRRNKVGKWWENVMCTYCALCCGSWNLSNKFFGQAPYGGFSRKKVDFLGASLAYQDRRKWWSLTRKCESRPRKYRIVK